MKAIFGTFNIDMLPIEAIDVSNKVSSYLKENVIVIPGNTVFRDVFGDVGGKGKRYLQLSANNQVYNILEDQYVEDIKIELSHAVNNIKIVYYFFTSPNSNWRAILSGQLYQLKSYGILSEADLYIHVTDANNYTDEIKEIIKNIFPAAIVHTSFVNQFEYPALKLAHDLAVESPESIILYFHSKGMTHNLHSRALEEIFLLTKTFQNWRKNIQLLNTENKQKAGLFSSKEGWIWYNFWYAKGEYLAKCSAPEISDNRYYYEGWLGLANPERTLPADDCLNLFKIKNVSKQYFTPVEADIYKVNLMEKLFSHAERKEFRVVRTSFMIHCQLKIDSFFKLFKKRKK
ncbi:hypothetical protein SAMN05216464_12058 [Mucilaginibacter pineti]|uniref:Uncharacterized protein n=1 Tax=Mucilaginibacter pineti TaxID=1391627 RepID=A0A1G7M436_9SPHI|nr:hypothetical protein [Mucilaginibacter pineti]SDF56558.1 hypothetical protein SAMN05216464_12058 [Mucilaginibacter pineti]